MKRCIEASPSAPRTLKSAKDDTTTPRRRGLNFAVAADKQDLSSVEREVRKNYNFYCVINKLSAWVRQHSIYFVVCMVIHDCDTSIFFSHLQNDLPEPLEISQTMNLQENAAQPKVNLFLSLFSFIHKLVVRLLVK